MWAAPRIWPVLPHWPARIVRPWGHVIPVVTWAMSLKLLSSPLPIPFKSPVIRHPGFIIWFMIRTWRTPPTGEKSLWFTVFFSFAMTWLTSGATVRISWIFRPTSKSVFIITWSPRKRTVSVFLFYLHFWACYAVLPFQQLFHFKTLVKKGSRGISWRGIPLLFPILIFIMGRSSRWAFFGAASRLRSMPTLFPTFLVIRGRGGGRGNWYIWWWIAWWWGGGRGWRRRRRGGGSRYFPFLLQPKKIIKLWDNLQCKAKTTRRKQICIPQLGLCSGDRNWAWLARQFQMSFLHQKIKTKSTEHFVRKGLFPNFTWHYALQICHLCKVFLKQLLFHTHFH